MAKPFGKRPVDWLNLTSTRQFIDTLREVRFPNITPEESSGLVETVRGNFSGGKEQGTWMHEDVARNLLSAILRPVNTAMNLVSAILRLRYISGRYQLKPILALTIISTAQFCAVLLH